MDFRGVPARIMRSFLPPRAPPRMLAPVVPVPSVMKRLSLLAAACLPLFSAVPALRAAESLEDLRKRQDTVKAVVERVMPAVVAIVSTDPEKPGSGSGVIINKEGFILTAAHVTDATGNDLTIIFPDGRRVKGTSLGANRTTDAGMAKITDPGEWPFAPLGSSDSSHLGDWVIAMGHPGGFSYERRPPVRLGRVWRRDLDGAFFTSCPLIGGDSGGPLFDMQGRVIGIHSSIHGSVDMNRHIALDTLLADREKMEKDQRWGKMTFTTDNDERPITGAVFDRESQDGVKVTEVFDNLPAARAGLKSGDVIIRMAGQNTYTFHALQRVLSARKPGDKVALTIRRGEGTVDTEIELGRRKSFDAEGPPGGMEPNVPAPSPDRPYFGGSLEDTGGMGARLASLKENSPAAKAGLLAGDLILKVDEADTPDPTAAADLIGAKKPGEKLVLKIRRGDAELTLEVTLEKP